MTKFISFRLLKRILLCLLLVINENRLQQPMWLSRPFSRSRDRDRDLDKMNSIALESRDHGLEITTLAATIPIGDRALT